jgi:hypothetical protein
MVVQLLKKYLVLTEAEGSLPESESYITTDGQSASLSWNNAPIWSLRPDSYYCQTVAVLLIWGALSVKRTGLSFIIGAGPRHRNHFQIRVPCTRVGCYIYPV